MDIHEQMKKIMDDGWKSSPLLDLEKMDLGIYKSQGSADAWKKMFQAYFSPTQNLLYGVSGFPSAKSAILGRLRHDYEPVIFSARVFGEQHFAASISDQQLYDEAAGAMMRQARKGTQPGGAIVYRSGGQGQCVVGHLIEEQRYSSALEGTLVADVAEIFTEHDAAENHEKITLHLHRNAVTAALRFSPTDHQVRMLFQLQQMHDRVPVEDWPIALRVLGENLELDCRIVDDLEGDFGNRARSAIPSPKMMLLNEMGSLSAGQSQLKWSYADYHCLETKLLVGDFFGEDSRKSIYDCQPVDSDAELSRRNNDRPVQPHWHLIEAYQSGDETSGGEEPLGDSTDRHGIWFGEKILQTS